MGLPVEDGDIILISALGSTASLVRFVFRLRLPDGGLIPFQGDLTSSTDRTLGTAQIGPLPEGEIVTADTRVLADAASGPGRVFVFAELQSGGSNIAFILAGYIYGTHTPSFPGVLEGSLDGRGFMRVISLGDPAAGSDYTDEAVPTNARWKVPGFIGTCVADANAE